MPIPCDVLGCARGVTPEHSGRFRWVHVLGSFSVFVAPDCTGVRREEEAAAQGYAWVREKGQGAGGKEYSPLELAICVITVSTLGSLWEAFSII